MKDKIVTLATLAAFFLPTNCNDCNPRTNLNLDYGIRKSPPSAKEEPMAEQCYNIVSIDEVLRGRNPLEISISHRDSRTVWDYQVALGGITGDITNRDSLVDAICHAKRFFLNPDSLLLRDHNAQRGDFTGVIIHVDNLEEPEKETIVKYLGIVNVAYLRQDSPKPPSVTVENWDLYKGSGRLLTE